MRKIAMYVALSSCLFLTACGRKSYSDTKIIYTMDTIVTCTIYNDKDASKHLNKVKEIYDEIHLVCDDYKSGKDIVSVYDLNLVREALVSDTLLDILIESNNIYLDTKGYFNPFIGSLSHKWKEAMTKKEVLDDVVIQDELIKIKNTRLEINENKVTIVGEGNIDLGGIAKGYATNLAKKYLEKEGIKSYYIDAGSSSLAFGNKNEGNFSIGLSNPLDNKKYIGILKEKDISISCSSVEHQSVIIDNNRYHHLINPYLGYPSNQYDGVYIINDNPEIGDAYSTAIFNMEYEDAISFSKEKNISIIICKDNKIIYKSEGVNLYE